MSRFKKTFIIILIILSLAVQSSRFASAQALPDFSVTTAYTIKDPDLEDGDIVSLNREDGAIKRSVTAYDETMHGVYVKNPKIVYRSPGNNDPVARNGEVDVNVSTLNGVVKIGDYVSSSPIPGKGQLATDFTGYMLGVALAPFGEKDGVEITFKEKKYRSGKIKVAIGIGPASPSVIKASGGLFGTIRFLGSSLAYNVANSKQAERLIKIILAVLIALASIFMSVHFFGKNVTQGIESIGRNPLARSTIQTMIILNIILIASIAIGGIIVALVIISL